MTMDVPGFLFFDHVAVAVPPGELEAQVDAYRSLGFREVHREEVLGRDQVREVMLQVGDGPNLIQLLEPLTADSPVAKQIAQNGGRGGLVHLAVRDVTSPPPSRTCVTAASGSSTTRRVQARAARRFFSFTRRRPTRCRLVICSRSCRRKGRTGSPNLNGRSPAVR